MPKYPKYSQLAAPDKCLVNALTNDALERFDTAWPHLIPEHQAFLRELMLALYGPERIKQEIATKYPKLLTECPNAAIAHGLPLSTDARSNPELRAR